MRHKWILAVVVLVAVVGLTFLYFNDEAVITGAIPSTSEPVDLLTFDYSAVTKREDFPKVNVTGVIDDICMLSSLPLWNRAGGGQTGGQVAITVKGCPGTPMHVVEVQQIENTTWFKVQKYEKRNNMEMWWEGWVTDKAILQGPLPIPLEEYQKMNQ